MRRRRLPAGLRWRLLLALVAAAAPPLRASEESAKPRQAQGSIDGKLWKFEGNPLDPMSKGRLCPRGTAAVGTHYDPDRIRQPLLRVGWAIVRPKAP